MSKLDIRKMSRAELDIAVDWAASEGWNPGLYDADCFYETDPDGFFMAFIDGEPVGSISAVAYGDIYGFIGFFIVRPEFRGHRVGLDLGQVGMAHLGNRLIGIDGVENKVKNYETHGFKLAFNNARYEGVATANSSNYAPDPFICLLEDVSFETMALYDKRIFGVSRDNFIAKWISQPEAHAFAALNENSELSGYGVIRKCRRGYKIGPLFADSPFLAENIFQALLSKLSPGEQFYLDIPTINREAEKLAESAGMKIVFRTARMYNSVVDCSNIREVFGITSFELG
jgi:GNAT superfamily N-acetyltransferase